MKPDDESRVEGHARFRTTQWTVIMLATQSKTPEGKAALAELYEIYWFPIYALARRWGHPPHDAQDLTQSFFVDFMEREALTHVDQLKGKFRSFLLVSFQNDRSVEARRAGCLKRGGAAEFVSLNTKDAEDRYVVEPAEYLTPENFFDARWATTLLTQVLSRLGQAYASEGKSPTFEALKVFLDPINSRSAPSYEEVASRIQVSTGAASPFTDREAVGYFLG